MTGGGGAERSCLVFLSFIKEEEGRNSWIALKFKKLMECWRVSVFWSFFSLLFLHHMTILMSLYYLRYVFFNSKNLSMNTEF